MRPLTWIGFGLVLLAFDMRVWGFDLFANPLGWLMILIGIRHICRPATVAAVGLATAASFADLRLPYDWVYVDPETGRVVEPLTDLPLSYPERLVFDSLTGLHLALVALGLAAAALAMWMLLQDLTARAHAAGRTSAARQLGLLRALVPGLWIGPHLLAALSALVAGGSYDPVWNHGMEYVALLGLIPVAWLAVLVALERDHAWALPTDPTDPTAPPHRLGHTDPTPP